MDKVLIFNTREGGDNAVTAHAAGCHVVTTARTRKHVQVVDTDVEAAEQDLKERGYPVKHCRCTK